MKLKMTNRLTAIALAAVMLGGAFALPAYADDDDDEVVVSSVDDDDDDDDDAAAKKKEKEKAKKEKEEAEKAAKAAEKDDEDDKRSSKKDDDDDGGSKNTKVDYSDDEADVKATVDAKLDAADDTEKYASEKRGRYYEEDDAPEQAPDIVVSEEKDDPVKNREDYTEPATEEKTSAPAVETKTESTTEDKSWADDDTQTYWHDGSESDFVEAEITLKKGQTLNPSYYTSFAGATYNWYSADPSVVSISNNGVFTANKPGITVVTATNPFEYIIFSVYVIDDGFKEKNVTLYTGDRLDLTQYVDLPYYMYEWTAANKNIAEVDEYGKLKAYKEGTTRVVADGEGVDKDYIFNVTVKRSSGSSSTKKRDYYGRKFVIYLDDRDSVDVSEYLEKSPSSYSWEVGDERVAKANKSSGVIKGVAYGNTDIRVLGSKDYYFEVKVGKYYDNCTVDMRVDDTFDLSKYLDDPSDYNYSYLDSKVAVVKSGKIQGLKRGMTYIICDNKYSKEIVQIMVEVKGSGGQSSSKAAAAKVREEEKQQKTAPETPSTPSAPVVTEPVVQEKGFKDIFHRQWAVGAINNMAAKGYINGRSADVFAPDDNCSKADFSIVLTKMLGIENDDYTGGFDDVASSKYYAKYVNVARQYGICAGVSGNSFKPETSITREEVMYMVYKGLELKGRNMDTDTSALGAYTDSSLIGEEYKTAVAALLNEGIVSGVSDTQIDPKATITRAQMAVLLNNLGM